MDLVKEQLLHPALPAWVSQLLPSRRLGWWANDSSTRFGNRSGFRLPSRNLWARGGPEWLRKLLLHNSEEKENYLRSNSEMYTLTSCLSKQIVILVSGGVRVSSAGNFKRESRITIYFLFKSLLLVCFIKLAFKSIIAL